MRKIKMTESDLARIVKKVIQEQQTSAEHTISPDHPVNDPLYKQFTSDTEGDNVSGKKIDKNTLQINCGWGPVYQLKKIR